MSPSASSGDRPPLAPPFFATQPPTAPARAPRQETPDPGTGATGADESAGSPAAGFPWEGDRVSEESELVLGDVVQAGGTDAGEMVLTEIVETTEREEATAGAGFPEDAMISPEPEPADVQGPAPVSSVHDPEAAAERLEQLARRIRHGGPEGLAQLVAASDRFEAVVAAVVAGYFAGLHDRQR